MTYHLPFYQFQILLLSHLYQKGRYESFASFHFIITAGCENGCSGHGQCTLEEGLYKCVCIQGWAGTDCSIPLEQECHDDLDNDHGECLQNQNVNIILFKTTPKAM